MGWKAVHGHVSQIFHHPGDAPGVTEGANDCFETSLARYLLETGYRWSGSDDGLVEALRQAVTGQPDHAGQGFTSLAQAAAGLDKLGIAYKWVGTLAEAQAAAWAICWVRAGSLRLAQAVMADGVARWTAYPPGWLASEGAQPDHFILKLPDGRFNDPLAYWVGDCAYSRTSLAGAFGGAWILRSPARGSSPSATSPTPAPVPALGNVEVTATAGLHLREAPSLDAPVLATLAHGERCQDVYGADCLWTFVTARGQHGWLRREYTRKAV